MLRPSSRFTDLYIRSLPYSQDDLLITGLKTGRGIRSWIGTCSRAMEQLYCGMGGMRDVMRMHGTKCIEVAPENACTMSKRPIRLLMDMQMNRVKMQEIKRRAIIVSLLACYAEDV